MRLCRRLRNAPKENYDELEQEFLLADRLFWSARLVCKQWARCFVVPNMMVHIPVVWKSPVKKIIRWSRHRSDKLVTYAPRVLNSLQLRLPSGRDVRVIGRLLTRITMDTNHVLSQLGLWRTTSATFQRTYKHRYHQLQVPSEAWRGLDLLCLKGWHPEDIIEKTGALYNLLPNLHGLSTLQLFLIATEESEETVKTRVMTYLEGVFTQTGRPKEVVVEVRAGV